MGQNRADINAQGDRVGNALHAAVSAGSEGVVRLLLDRGADVNKLEEQYRNQCRSLIGLPAAMSVSNIDQDSEVALDGR